MYQFFHKVMGTTFYQFDWDQLCEGDEIDLVLEPENVADDRAIKVCHAPVGEEDEHRTQGQVGHLPRALAAQLHMDLANEVVGYRCCISNITGRDKPNQGINLHFTIANLHQGAEG